VHTVNIPGLRASCSLVLNSRRAARVARWSIHHLQPSCGACASRPSLLLQCHVHTNALTATTFDPALPRPFPFVGAVPRRHQRVKHTGLHPTRCSQCARGTTTVIPAPRAPTVHGAKEPARALALRHLCWVGALVCPHHPQRHFRPAHRPAPWRRPVPQSWRRSCFVSSTSIPVAPAPGKQVWPSSAHNCAHPTPMS